MKVYLITDILVDGKIKEAEGNPQTGHPETLQLNNVKVTRWGNAARIVRKGDWFTSLEEAKLAAVEKINKQIENCEKQILYAKRNILWYNFLKEGLK